MPSVYGFYIPSVVLVWVDSMGCVDSGHRRRSAQTTVRGGSPLLDSQPYRFSEQERLVRRCATVQTDSCPAIYESVA